MSKQYKIDRTIGQNILGRAKSPINKRNYKPGMHGNVHGKIATRSLTTYGEQLKERKKICHYFGKMRAKKIKTLTALAIRQKGASDNNLCQLLESLLSNIVYKAKWAMTPFAARQLVNHGHILVNSKKVDIWSYRVKVGDKVTLHDYMRNNSDVMIAQGSTERNIPEYLKMTGFTLEVMALPTISSAQYPGPMRFNLLVAAHGR